MKLSSTIAKHHENSKYLPYLASTYPRPILSANNIAKETASNTTDRAIDLSRSLSEAMYTAIGIVCVVPGKLPANVIVAPNSPRARAQDRPIPDNNAGRIKGSTTRRKV